MAFRSINPATGRVIETVEEHTAAQAGQILNAVDAAFQQWKATSFAERSRLMKRAAGLLRAKKETYARMMAEEMGKPITQAIAEAEKCALACDYYAEHAEEFLKQEAVATDAGKSYVRYEPLGTVLAIMPWNFPFWQVFRFAAPALMAGNACVLKHASNVPRCALAIEQAFREAGFPENAFRTLLTGSAQVEQVIAHPAIRAVTLTGSNRAGASVAAIAGKHIKKTVLELGGSDPFIVLADAEMGGCAAGAAASRLVNAGQSCIAAKRFIVVNERVNEFEEAIAALMNGKTIGDPLDPATEIGPLARSEFVDELERQVNESVAQGARLVTGGRRVPRAGFFYAPTVLGSVRKGMPAFDEEVFGPVAAVIAVADEEEAIRVANDHIYGLGASIWTRDTEKAERLAARIDAGHVAINGIVKSDPRLPFGGVKASGYGRELGCHGIREFVNVKSVWVR